VRNVFTGVKTLGMDMEKDKVIGFGTRRESKFVVFVTEKADLEHAKKFAKLKNPKGKVLVNRTLLDFIPS